MVLSLCPPLGTDQFECCRCGFSLVFAPLPPRAPTPSTALLCRGWLSWVQVRITLLATYGNTPQRNVGHCNPSIG
jgi:hypothetical protein